MLGGEASMTAKSTRGRWKKGESGNPQGKPPGSGELQRLRAAISEHVPEIIGKLVEGARGGDIQAARLILERVLPPMKAIEQAQPVNLAGETLTEQGRAVLSAIACGELSAGQGAALIGAIATLGKVAELDELARRVAALEKTHGKR
jgi:hypothetical protein